MTANTDTATSLTIDAERADLLDQLGAARSALLTTVRGLSDEQAGERPTVGALCLGVWSSMSRPWRTNGCASWPRARQRCATTCPKG